MENNTNNIVEKIKTYVMSNKKKVGIISGIVIVCLIIMTTVLSGPISVINDVKPEFSGYDGSGTLSYNEKEIRQKVEAAVLKKYGASQADIDNTLQGDITKVLSNIFSNGKKYLEIQSVLSSISYKFDKTKELKNGDKVMFTISATDKNAPIRPEKKEFVVSGLKDVQKVSAEDVVKDSKINVTGYNGFGSLEYNQDKVTLVSSKNKSFSNGDKLTFKINDYYITGMKKEGKVVTNGTDETTVTVEGLKEVTDITNLNTLIDKIDDYAKAENKNVPESSYEKKKEFVLERATTFFKYSTSNYNSTDTMNVVNIYKITETKGSDTKTYYKVYGYTVKVSVSDNQLILADLSNNKYSLYDTFEDLESAKVSLRSSDFVEYTKK
ncbi:hypothetical protein KG091_06175 [Carnobacteriaceae bacterium zg-ZUI78]|nr:hypothetical protein [Carnobacteriaceae bacterium zg-ZUI78]